MTRRPSSFKDRCFQILAVGALLYGTAILLDLGLRFAWALVVGGR